ncbi:MAG TPA: 6-hydroxymethylpterin diphosphokinase MptE-like protein [Candidatus Bathyarchaeia archaeon]|nr:6-hydroxymethylpterin diphosphokinase MptE-like protein [Candidatus Bathyarchaeia archaeon]
MRYSDWEPIYEEILKDFGFDRAKDDEAAKVASAIIAYKRKTGEKTVKQEIEEFIKGKRVFICGNAPCLERDIREKEKEFDVFHFSRDCVVIAADGATSVLLRNAIIPDLVCTDLDGTIADIITANRLGAMIVVHAHGDNIEMLKKVLPALNENVLCTTQSKPLHNVHNFGGFTDGDRCVFLAKEFGARSIELIGFDFEDEQVSERKRKKLTWAKRLIGEIL